MVNDTIWVGQLSPSWPLQGWLGRTLDQRCYHGIALWPMWDGWSRKPVQDYFSKRKMTILFSLVSLSETLWYVSWNRGWFPTEHYMFDCSCTKTKTCGFEEICGMTALCFSCLWIYCSPELNSYKCIYCRWRRNRGNASLENVQPASRRNKAIKWKRY